MIDDPAVERFVARAVAAARDLALALAGEADAKVLATLREMELRLRDQLAALLGAELATKIAETFIAVVLARRAKLEAAMSPRAQ